MDRNQEIVRLRTAGVKLAEIGAQFGITRERVRQICAKAGLFGRRLHPCATTGCKGETTYGRDICGVCATLIKRRGYATVKHRPPRLPDGTLCPCCQQRPARPYAGKCLSCCARQRYHGDADFRARCKKTSYAYTKKARAAARMARREGMGTASVSP